MVVVTLSREGGKCGNGSGYRCVGSGGCCADGVGGYGGLKVIDSGSLCLRGGVYGSKLGGNDVQYSV